MFDRWITRCLRTVACAATFALTAETFAGGCYGGYGDGYGGYRQDHHGGYGYRFPRAYGHGYHSRGYYSTDYRRHNRYWGPGYCYSPSRYPYGYSYGPYPHRYSYYPRYSSATPSYERQAYPSYGPTSAVEVYEGGAPANDAARQAAWDLLRSGRAAEAQSSFARWARAKPEIGEPKLGYALASAMRRDHVTATMAMRRALEADPNALHYFQGDEALRARVRELIDLYAYRSANRELGTDPLFMTAALYYLLGDYDMANEAIMPVLRVDERDVAIVALRHLIDAELEVARDEPIVAVD